MRDSPFAIASLVRSRNPSLVARLPKCPGGVGKKLCGVFYAIGGLRHKLTFNRRKPPFNARQQLCYFLIHFFIPQ